MYHMFLEIFFSSQIIIKLNLGGLAIFLRCSQIRYRVAVAVATVAVAAVVAAQNIVLLVYIILCTTFYVLF